MVLNECFGYGQEIQNIKLHFQMYVIFANPLNKADPCIWGIDF